MKSPVLFKFLISAAILFQSCITHKAQFEGNAFGIRADLEGTNFTPQQFGELTQHLEDNLATTSMMILQNGEVLYEYGDVTEVSYIASCRKSVLSILYGKYVEKGNIDLNQSIGSLGIEEAGGLLDIEKTATVDHIITSRSGVFYRPANKGYDEDNILKRGSVEPGKYFVYNNWDFNVAGYILEQAAGKSVYQEIEEQLAIPLGFQDWNIKNQKKRYSKKGSKYPAYHIYISTRDMAKIGQLMLNKGKWNGEQLISEEWIEKITSTVTPTEVVNQRIGLNESSPYQFSYAYMWWMIEDFKDTADFEGAYSATGYGGQFITIIPKRNMLIVHKTKMDLFHFMGLKSDVPDWQYWALLKDFVATST